MTDLFPTEDSPSPVQDTDGSVQESAVEDSAEQATENPVEDNPGPAEPDGFEALGLRPELLRSIAALGYEEPTPIQMETVPLLLAGNDLLGQAATGTGKTAAFALPILNAIEPGTPNSPVALILTPTRELCVQVSEALFKYGRELGVKVVPIFGGQPIGRQLAALDRGVHVVVATPGRALDHIGRGSLRLDKIRTVVLDEADEMLDMGFTDDIEAILDSTPDERQTVLFSATMPGRIKSIAKRYQRDPVHVQIGKGKSDPGKTLIRQTAYVVQRNHKASALGRILDIESPGSTIVFCRTRTEVDELTSTMNGRSYRAEALHGGMDQNQRDRVMSRLRDGTAELLVATDVAARGLDVDTLTHVVNFDVPSAAESYVHRIGRVGRAGREGVAITLVEPKQRRLLGNIERLTKQTIKIEKVPSVADLRERQIEMTVAAVSEAIGADDLEDYEGVLEGLTGDADLRTIALAAIKLVHAARGATVDEQEIPDFSERSNQYDGKKRGNDRSGGSNDGQKHGGQKHGGQKHGGQKHGQRPGGGDRGRKGQPTSGDTAFVHISLGKKAGMRPGDLVGAIANETNLSGREIGPIRISDNFSVVGVPESAVQDVINIMSGAMLRGKKAKLRRYVD